MIIRNDDVSFDTNLRDFQIFCDICDEYGFKIIQCITVMGECLKSHCNMTDDQIISASKENIFNNKPLVDYLLTRNDIIAVHGLWHTHEQNERDVEEAKKLLINAGLYPTYFVPPFNEGKWGDEFCGLKVCCLTLKERLENYLLDGSPNTPIVYLHSWRFGDWYKFDDLEVCLERLSQLKKPEKS